MCEGRGHQSVRGGPGGPEHRAARRPGGLHAPGDDPHDDSDVDDNDTQDICLYLEFTIQETFTYFGRLQGLARDVIDKKMTALLELLNLPSDAGRMVIIPHPVTMIIYFRSRSRSSAGARRGGSASPWRCSTSPSSSSWTSPQVTGWTISK